MFFSSPIGKSPSPPGTPPHVRHIYFRWFRSFAELVFESESEYEQPRAICAGAFVTRCCCCCCYPYSLDRDPISTYGKNANRNRNTPTHPAWFELGCSIVCTLASVWRWPPATPATPGTLARVCDAALECLEWKTETLGGRGHSSGLRWSALVTRSYHSSRR